MDVTQQRVLRRKRHAIARAVTLNESTVTELRDRRLITSAMLNGVKDEKSNFGKMLKYLALLESPSSSGLGARVFERLCAFLEACHPFVHDQLAVELQEARGELAVEAYVRGESQALVDREFEVGRRVQGRAERDDMVELLALRTQIAKEVWKRRRAATEASLARMTDTTGDRNALLRHLLKSVSDFVLSQRGRLASGGAGLGPDAPLDVDAIPREELPELLLCSASDLIALSEQSLGERQLGVDKKVRVTKVLGVGEKPNSKMDVETNAWLDQLGRELVACEGALTKKRQYTVSVRRRLAAVGEDMKLQRMRMDELIEATQRRLVAAEGHTGVLQRRVDELKGGLEEAQRQEVIHRAKYSVMHNARRLGYADPAVLGAVKEKESAVVLPRVDRVSGVTTRRPNN